ncbi:MAG: thiol-activated cytolysin family protein [Treponema sp.]|nr:thiol-activated cytolysin family protein [Treponema sp.]
MKKHSYIFALSILLLVGLSSCVSVKRARNLVLSGDKVSAIEVLCKIISNGKKDQAEAIALFIEIYPSTVEEMKPQESVAQVRKEFAAKYGSSEIQAIKNCGESCSSLKSVLTHPDISNVIKTSEKIILAYNGLARIKKAVSVLPRTLYDEKTGEHEVVKYSDDFAGMAVESKKGLAEFYYNIAEAFFPGRDAQERIWIIEIYKKAESTYSGIGQTAARCAELCYLNGQEYERLNTVEGNKQAITWYRNALAWSRNYKDCNDRVQILSYEIAMVLLGQAKTKQDYKEVIQYLSYAGNYKDAQEQILQVKYHLAYIYRNERTLPSYEEAGRLFSELGNYKNAPYETNLYLFYKKLIGLSKNYSYSNIYLLTANYAPFSVTRNVVPRGDGTANLSLSASTSDFGVYIPSMEKTIYPGAIVEGESVASQAFNSIPYASRLPISCHLNYDGRNLASVALEYPNDGNLSTKEIKRVAKIYASSLNADCDYEFQRIYSLEDLAISTGMGAARDKVSYAMSAYNWNPEKTYTLIKIRQKFYSANVDSPELPIDFFAVDQKAASPALLKNVTPYYISSVDYGRMAYFVVCSDLSSEEIIKDFVSCRPRDKKNRGSTGLRANPDISAKWAQNGTTVRSITVSEKVYSISDLDGIFNWIKLGTSLSLDIDNMVPISFALKNLADNSYARLSQTKSLVVTLPKKETAAAPSNTGSNTNNGGQQTQPATTQDPTPSQPTTPASTQETASKINGTNVPASAYNGDTSLILVGKKGYYKCTSISVEQGSGVKTYYYDVPADEIEVCVASWSDSEFNTVTVNGISMLKNRTVYSFRDVHGNTISLDTVDPTGKRVHNLLVVRKY